MRMCTKYVLYNIVLSFFLIVGGGALAHATSDQFSVSMQLGEDIEAPTVPTIISVTPVTSTQIDVEWTASIDNFAVAGYQLFRDLLQIATTSLTSYIDTGLLASTTYSYTVRAFDSSGNFSTSSPAVATTTFPVIVPEPEVVSTSSSASSSRHPLPQLKTFELVPSTEGVRIAFETDVPIRYVLRYGVSDVYSGGIVEGELFKISHVTTVFPLDPQTTYQFELRGYDRFNREILLMRDSFTTLAVAGPPQVPNVSNFKAIPFVDDVMLSWDNPTFSDFAYVRIVRSHLFFPVDEFDGYVVYEGPVQEFIDNGALSDSKAQYYTIFTYTLSGTRSSGAIAFVKARDPSPAGDIKTLPTDERDEIETEPFDLNVSYADVEFVQNGVVMLAHDRETTIQAQSSFTLRVPYELFPERLKVIAVTLTHPQDQSQIFSFLLRANESFTHYEATLSGLQDVGLYDMLFTVFDVQAKKRFGFEGVVNVVEGEGDDGESSEVVKDTAGLWMLILLSLTGVLLLLCLWYLLPLLVRRWREDKRSISSQV